MITEKLCNESWVFPTGEKNFFHDELMISARNEFSFPWVSPDKIRNCQWKNLGFFLFHIYYNRKSWEIFLIICLPRLLSNLNFSVKIIILSHTTHLLQDINNSTHGKKFLEDKQSVDEKNKTALNTSPLQLHTFQLNYFFTFSFYINQWPKHT